MKASKNKKTRKARSSHALMAAALALPGVVANVAHAQVTAPNATLVQFKYLYYKDYQDSGPRMKVSSPALYMLTPITEDWVFEIGAVHDSISGASPYYHTTLSGASGRGINDSRNAADVTITKYFETHTALSARVAYSNENDYRSKAGGVTLRQATPDQNTTLTIGGGYSDDNVFPVIGPQFDKKKRTVDALVGLSQVLSTSDIAQLNVYYARQTGYLTDPYKAVYGIDNRPDKRDQRAALVRWNHSFSDIDATSRLSYRFYDDSWKVQAHTFTFEWAQGLPGDLVVTPSLRYTSESSAYFYYDPIYDPILGAPYPPGYLNNPNGIYSGDQRLSAYGGLTPGIKLEKGFGAGWSVDASAQYYEQRGSWRMGGKGSVGLEDLKAQIYSVGVTKRF